MALLLLLKSYLCARFGEPVEEVSFDDAKVYIPLSLNRTMGSLSKSFLDISPLSPSLYTDESVHDESLLKERTDILWVGSDLDAFMTIPNSEIDSFIALGGNEPGIVEAANILKQQIAES